MTTTNVNLMKRSQTHLSGKWGNAVLTFFIYLVIVSILASIGKLLKLPIVFLVAGVLQFGLATYALNVVRMADVETSQIFDGFKRFWATFLVLIIQIVLVFIGLFLLIVPGVILSLGLAMTYFILCDDENIGAVDALKKSYSMMEGYKLKFFKLQLRLLGLAILCILTLGIGFLWLYPYMYVCYANFYEDIKNEPVSIK